MHHLAQLKNQTCNAYLTSHFFSEFMKTSHPLFMSLTVFFFCFPFFLRMTNKTYSSSSWQHHENKIIKEIQFQNLKHQKEDFLLENLTLRKGNTFNSSELQDNFKWLLGLNVFSNISVQIFDTDKTSISIIFFCEEFPIVDNIFISGNNKIETKNIAMGLSLQPGLPFQETLLSKDRDHIQKLYKSKYFENIKISANMSGQQNNKVNVDFHIVEGAKIPILQVQIIGTQYFNPDQLAKKMNVREYNILKKSYGIDEAMLNKDIAILEQHFRNSGYYEGKVQFIKFAKQILPKEKHKQQRSGYVILLEVNEGKQFKLGSLNFTGDTLFSKKQLEEKVNLKSQEIYRENIFQEGLQAIQASYHNKGFMEAQIRIANISPNHSNNTLDITVEIIRGQRSYIHQINITGNTKTFSRVVDQELVILEGELFNRKKIQTSTLNLLNTQFFEYVKPEIEHGIEDGLINLTFNLKERRTTQLKLIGGYSDSTFYIGESLQENNLFGSGWMIRENLEYGGTKKFKVELGVGTKWLAPYCPINFNFDIKYHTLKKEIQTLILHPDPHLEYEYRLKFMSLSFGLGYPVLSNLFLYGNFNFDMTKYTDPKNFSSKNIDTSNKTGQFFQRDLEKQQFIKSLKLSFGLIRDTTDIKINPTMGTIAKTSWTYAGGFMQGSSHWMKWKNSLVAYTMPFWKIVFASFAHYTTFFNQLGGRFETREYESIQFNGLNEMRGWNNTITGNPNGSIHSEGSKLTLTQEIRFPISEKLVWGSFFLDVGDFKSERPSFPLSLRYFSAGFGVRFIVPFLPIIFYISKRADYGITNPNKLNFHKGFALTFSISGYS